MVMSLPQLKRPSGVRIATSVVYGLTSGGGHRLIRMTRRGSDYYGIPRAGVHSVASNLQYRQRLMNLDASKHAFMRTLNRQLKGGTTYPVLLFALSTAVGAASAGAGLLFGVSTLMVDLNRRDTDVLARKGDEVWAIEEIGRVYEDNTFSSDRWIAVHVMSYFLNDPFRAQGSNPEKGWLIHEHRTRVILDDEV